MFKKGHKGYKKPTEKIVSKKEVKKNTPKNIKPEETIIEDEISYEDIENETEDSTSVFKLQPEIKPSEKKEEYENLEDLLKVHTFSQDLQINPNITEVDEQTKNQLKDLREFEKKEKDVTKSGGKVNYYPSVSVKEQKLSDENVKNQIINLLMSNEGLSFLEARAKVEEINTSKISFEQLKTDIEQKINTQTQTEEKQNTSPEVYIQKITRTIKHY